MSFSEYAELFRTESREHVAAINHLLLAWEAEPSAAEPLEGIFRAVHTIKGMAATMGYGLVADVAHEMESVLDLLRQRRSHPAAGLIELLFEAADAIDAGVGEDANDAAGSGWDAAPLLARLREEANRLASEDGAAGAEAGAAPAEATAYRVRLVVDADAALPGVRAVLALRRARMLGEVGGVTPAEAAIQRDEFDRAVEFVLTTAETAAEVSRLLKAVGDLEEVAVEAATAPGATAASAGGAGGEVPAAASAFSPAAGSTERHVRVEAERLDSLLDRIGELVILRDRVLRVAAAVRTDELTEPAEHMARLIGELREEVMRIRMVRVGQVFDRFPRLVRDAAQQLGKRVEFVIEGREIELDRSLLERLGEPLVHLLRNAVDHGIEAPAARRERGKPEIARLRLMARRERDRVLIRVEDDGRGIERERVVRKAVQQGLIAQADATELANEEILHLITRPGFSTAERVTDVSGRGVGLDVVATQVRALGGVLDIASRPDAGTSFTLRLPLTVGIVRALLVRSGESIYAIPVAHVAETVEFWAGQIHELGGRRAGLLRGEPVPLLPLRAVLRLDAVEAVAESVPVVLLELDEQVVGLEVDELLGQQEIVIKPFDGTRDTLPVFSGATILSDGRPALILDAAGLLQHGRLPGLARV